MKASFWHACWEKNSLGFHQTTVHPFLYQHLLPLISAKNAESNTDKNQAVLVPLCGKSDDMVWLAEHFDVVGAELSDIACRDFFREKNLAVTPTYIQDKHSQATFKQYCFENITLWQGDFFKLSTELLPDFDWIYDRAAIIALPQTMQQSYSSHLAEFISEHTQLFLISLEFPQQELSGPPFAIFEHDLNRLFPNFNVKCIAEHELADKTFAQRTFKVSYLKEKLYLITR